MRAWQLRELARTLHVAAVDVDERAAVLAKYETTDGLDVDKTEQIVAERDRLRETVAELRRMNDSQARALHAIRVALHGEGCNPLEAHARRVFAALKGARPNHPLVRGGS